MVRMAAQLRFASSFPTGSNLEAAVLTPTATGLPPRELKRTGKPTPCQPALRAWPTASIRCCVNWLSLRTRAEGCQRPALGPVPGPAGED